MGKSLLDYPERLRDQLLELSDFLGIALDAEEPVIALVNPYTMGLRVCFKHKNKPSFLLPTGTLLEAVDGPETGIEFRLVSLIPPSSELAKDTYGYKGNGTLHAFEHERRYFIREIPWSATPKLHQSRVADSSKFIKEPKPGGAQ
jgi:hypothetical protein